MAKGAEPSALARGLWARGVFPHQLAWMLDNPLRRVLLSPDALVERLGLTPTSRVLEVGPGPGYFSVALAARVSQGELALLDLQPEMIAKARRKLASAGLGSVGHACADAGQTFPFPDDHFDVALLVSVLGEVPDPPACVRAVRRALRPGGRLAVHESLGDPDRIAFDALVALVEAEGFRLERRFGPSWNYTATFERTGAA